MRSDVSEEVVGEDLGERGWVGNDECQCPIRSLSSITDKAKYSLQQDARQLCRRSERFAKMEI
jgi:hypothetical protein